MLRLCSTGGGGGGRGHNTMLVFAVHTLAISRVFSLFFSRHDERLWTNRRLADGAGGGRAPIGDGDDQRGGVPGHGALLHGAASPGSDHRRRQGIRRRRVGKRHHVVVWQLHGEPAGLAALPARGTGGDRLLGPSTYGSTLQSASLCQSKSSDKTNVTYLDRCLRATAE